MKSEPGVFSIQDLSRSKDQTTCWEGVRNYQARNFMRDEMKEGDGVLFYHSNAKPPGVAGTAVVVREGYPDTYAFKPGQKYHDPKSKKDDPTWFMVDIQLDEIFPEVVSLDLLKSTKSLASMKVVQRGMRLSVQPVTASEWKTVLKLAERLAKE